MYSSDVARRSLVRAAPLALLGLLLLARTAAAGSVALAWDANPESNLAGYRVVYGILPGQYTKQIDIGKRTTYTVSGLQSGLIYYFAVKAYNSAGLASAPSNEVWAWIKPTVSTPLLPGLQPAAPTPPSGETHHGYFAEGVEATLFQTRFALLNPTDEPAAVTMVFEDEAGSQYPRAFQLGARRRATVAARDIPELAGRGFSTHVASSVPIVVDRTVAWGAGRYGAHLETGVPTPSARWYLAEGIAWDGLFDLFYLVHNPNTSAAEIKVTYLLPGDQTPEVRRHTVGPHSRLTIWVNREGAPLGHSELSAVVESTNAVPVIAERALYLSTAGEVFMSGNASAGVTAPSTRWFFGEGATGSYFDLFFSLANPNDSPAEIRATYLLPSGVNVQRRYTLPARSRRTVYVDREGAALASTSVSAVLEATNGVPFLAERTMWWPGPSGSNWYESHSSFGATTTSQRWAVAEGEVGGAADSQSYLLVANTSATVGVARVTLLFEDGGRAERTFRLPPQSRTDISVARDFPESENRRFGALIESIGPVAAELVVEHALYWNTAGRVLAAGGVALGSPLP